MELDQPPLLQPAADRGRATSPGSSCRDGPGRAGVEDYANLRLSLKAHPLALLRDWLGRKRAITARQLCAITDGRRVTVCGLVLVRQRPGSAKGVIFATLEDETGFANLVVWPNRLRAVRRALS